MYINPNQGAGAPIVPPASGSLPDYQFENIRHLIFGSLTSVQLTIQELHSKQYAEPNDWSKPISTGRPNEVMVILTKKVRVA